MFCPGSGADRRTGRRHGIAQGRPGRGSNPQPLSNKPYGLLDVGASALRFPLAHPSSQCGHGSSSTPTATCSSRRPTTPPPSVWCASAGSCVPPSPPCICSAADSHGRRPTALTDRTPRSRAIGHPPAGLFGRTALSEGRLPGAEFFFEADDPVPGLGWFSQVIDQHVVETTLEESSEAR